MLNHLSYPADHGQDRKDTGSEELKDQTTCGRIDIHELVTPAVRQVFLGWSKGNEIVTDRKQTSREPRHKPCRTRRVFESVYSDLLRVLATSCWIHTVLMLTNSRNP